jgi:phosphoribosylaminoimidazolecarboxamide formyltransferase/IMP cyclohydrolase
MVKVKKALVSVSDKKGIKEFASGLHRLGVEILSTGGTAGLLKEAGIPVKLISDYTGFPEMLDGRLKTLHPRIHGALLALRENPEHMKQIKEASITPIDMVVVNLYPFEKTVAKADVKLEQAIENIDIGGPSMLRSGAKNFKDVAVISNPDRYGAVLKELEENDCSLGDETLASLGLEAFKLTSDYDGAIYDYLDKIKGRRQKTEGFPDRLNLSFKKLQELRYGENPHQKAAFYKEENPVQPGVVGARQLHGKELSFNNIIDLDAALEIVKEFEEPAASIVKHTNPCGAARADSLAEAYKKALECDPLSAFGSIIGLNRTVDASTAADIISAGFVEAIIAPGYEGDALNQLKKKKNLRILEVEPISLSLKQNQEGLSEKMINLKKVIGGLLIQDYDQKGILRQEMKVVTKNLPLDAEIDSLIFAWKICKHVKSNAIVLARDTYTVGIGAGQMSRVDSVIIARRKAGQRSKGSVLASDAFFPKRDAIDSAAGAGVKSIIQPGGSIHDQEIIDACNEHGISMVFTGVRHFKH